MNNKNWKKDAPRMTDREAQILWNSLNPVQRMQFNNLLEQMGKGKLYIEGVNFEDNGIAQYVTLKPIDGYSKPIKPFAKFFPKEKI